MNKELELMCPKLFKRVEEHSKYETFPRSDKFYCMKSGPVNICPTKNDSLQKEIDQALSDLINQVYLIKSLGFNVNLKELHWHNVLDSGVNLMGNIGFFVMTFTIKKIKSALVSK